MAKSANILLVDDDPFAREYVRSLLEQVGVASVREAANGLEAREMIETIEPDLVFLDINMTPGNGLEFLKEVRSGSTPASRDMPVIMMTVNKDDRVLGTAMALDCNAYLIKPASTKEIADKMLRVLADRCPARDRRAYEVIPVPDLEQRNHKGPSWATMSDEQPLFKKPEKKEEKELEIEPAVRAEGLDSFPDDDPFAERDPAKTGPTFTVVGVAPELLHEGQILAEDVHTNSGNLLLASGTSLSEIYIERLMNMTQISGLRKVKIRVPNKPGNLSMAV